MTAIGEHIEREENKMGVMSIPRLLITMAVPMMISMLVQAMYNIVDSIFIGHLSSHALTAVSMSYPFQTLIIAVGSGLSIGINAYLSRSLGEGKQEQANAAAMNGIFLCFVVYCIFALFGIFCSRFYFAAQTHDAEIIEQGVAYLSTCLTFSLGPLMQMTMERILQSTGKTVYCMICQGIGSALNIVLDPLLIFGLFGFPRLGVRGAAAATVFSQFVGAAAAFYCNVRKNHDIQLSLKGFRPDLRAISEIGKVGIPTMITQSLASVMTFSLNQILLMFSPIAVSVLGVYFKVQSFVFLPISGITDSMIPIVAYNYGAGRKKRIIDALRFATVFSTAILATGTILFHIIPEQLIGMFSNDAEMVRIGVPAITTISLSYVFAGVTAIFPGMFQALGNAVYSTVVSAARRIGIILPVSYLLASTFGLSAVWYAFPIAEIITMTLCLVLYKKLYKTKIKNLDDRSGNIG